MSTESEESSGIIEFLAWVETHRQTLIVGGMGAMVVGGAAVARDWDRSVVHAIVRDA